MADAEYWYNYYRQRYYSSCTEINSCEYEIYNLKNERQKTVNIVNQLGTDIKNTQIAYDGLEETLKGEENINNGLNDVINKTSQASFNFSSMVEFSDNRIKNLTDVYSNEIRNTKNTLNNVISTVKARKNSLSTKLSDLQNDLNRANAEIQRIDSDIKRLNSDIVYWKQQKTSNYYNMEYYRRKMIQDVC